MSRKFNDRGYLMVEDGAKIVVGKRKFTLTSEDSTRYVSGLPEIAMIV